LFAVLNALELDFFLFFPHTQITDADIERVLGPLVEKAVRRGRHPDQIKRVITMFCLDSATLDAVQKCYVEDKVVVMPVETLWSVVTIGEVLCCQTDRLRKILELFTLEVVRQSGLTNMFDVPVVSRCTSNAANMFPKALVDVSLEDVVVYTEWCFKHDAEFGGQIMPIDGDKSNPLASWIQGGSSAAAAFANRLRTAYK
jgi:hypothetical protein